MVRVGVRVGVRVRVRVRVGSRARVMGFRVRAVTWVMPRTRVRVTISVISVYSVCASIKVYIC